jgi:hypothetical protein
VKSARVHIVDTASVAPADAARYTALVQERIAPVMRDAGAPMIALRKTSDALGEEVLVQAIWGVADHAAWNRVRRNFFMDPRWHAAWAEAAPLRRGGTRRFFYPIEDGTEA